MNRRCLQSAVNPRALFIPLFCVMFIGTLGFISQAWAHDSWINRGDYRNPVTHSSCCGNIDCERVPATTVILRNGGYYLPSTGETIPLDEVQKSEDNDYWRCRYDGAPGKGKTRCLFVPDGTS